jgi:Ca-activated chloride channel family protein
MLSAGAQHMAATTGIATQKPSQRQLSGFKSADSGSLAVLDTHGKAVGKCPLKHTDVKAKISGYVARVTVKQTFENPFKDKIEAVYTFPLSDSGAVDDMVMKVGSRTIHGTIKRREEARKIYDDAKEQGHVASLLDQERTNIFTQSVANIRPGEKVEITLTYVDLLPYESGEYSFIFPTVVGPRFNPGQATGHQGTGWSADTSQVPDGSKITPPVTPQGTRSGHDLSMEVSIDSGVPINQVSSKLHEVSVNRAGSESATIQLMDKATIPNKDFVLSWSVAGDRLKSGYLTHRTADTGYFSLMILPPKRVTPAEAAPKEMVFLIDCSGSQSGPPLQKAKETMDYILDHMNPQDTFQVISFSSQLKTLFDKPEMASDSMRHKAKKFVADLQANGGTWIAPAVETACSIPADDHRLRIVSFMTDGYVGNDYEILGMVRKLRGTSRWFPFGTGNSVNRLLIDGMAKEGGGEPDYVLLNSSGAEVGKKYYDRIASPVLTDVKVDFGDLAVKDVFPNQISDVWAERPLYIKGTYTKPGAGTVTISGFSGGKPYVQKLAVTFPEKQSANAAISSIWARAKVDRLVSEDYAGAQRGALNPELKEEVIKVALDHHIMTEYTSFVAVEETVITDGGTPRTIAVPVEMPEGVSYSGVFGEADGGYGGAGGSPSPVRTRSMHQSYKAHRAGRLSNVSASLGRSIGGTLGKVQMQSAAGQPAPVSILPAPPMPGAPSLAAQEFRDAKESEASKPKPLTAADERRQKLSRKLAQSLQGLTEQLNKAGKEAKIAGVEIENGKVTVQVWLSDNSDAALAKLKRAGLEIIFQSSTAKMVIGKIQYQKLEELALLDIVRLVEPPKMVK